MLTPVKFKPGIVKDVTGHAGTGTWRDANLIRFRNGYPECMGGWTPLTETAVSGTIRSMKYCVSLNGVEYHHIGTTSKWYVRNGGTITDVTPIRETQALTNPFDTTISSAVVTVNDTGHLATDGDTVYISSSAAVGGITPDGEYVITYVDADTYTITHSSSATSSVTGGGGASVSIDYEISVGNISAVPALGWGADPWGDGGWGDPAAESYWTAQPSVWSFSAYGEDMIGAPTESGVYLWDATNPTTRAVALPDLGGASSSPTFANIILMDSKTRTLILFGVNEIGDTSVLNPLHIRWGDNESLIEFSPASTNNSGFLTVADGVSIVCAIEARQEIVFWTKKAMWSLQRVGGNLIYALAYLGGSVRCAGKNAAAVLNDVVYWFSADGFYSFDGSINKLPCPLEKYFRDRIDPADQPIFHASANPTEGEVMFFYKSAAGADIDSYILYSPSEGSWSIGSMTRTAWVETPFESYPVAAGTDGIIYYHEYGCSDGSENPPAALDYYIESAPFDDGSGDDFMFASKVVPDLTFFAEEADAETPSVTMTLKGLRYPGADYGTPDPESVGRTSTTPIEQYTTAVYPRVRGRALVLRYESAGRGYKWRLGDQRIEVRKDGKR